MGRQADTLRMWLFYLSNYPGISSIQLVGMLAIPFNVFIKLLLRNMIVGEYAFIKIGKRIYIFTVAFVQAVLHHSAVGLGIVNIRKYPAHFYGAYVVFGVNRVIRFGLSGVLAGRQPKQ